MVDRRTALSAVGTVVVGSAAGCLSDVFGGGNTSTAEQSQTVRVAEGEHWRSGTSGIVRIEYTAEVTDGPPVDVLVVDRSGFEALENENFDQFTYDEALSRTRTESAQASGDLESGFYAFVIDNSDRIGASPAGPGEAVVDFDYTLTLGS